MHTTIRFDAPGHWQTCEVDVHTDDDGTTVTIAHLLWHPFKVVQVEDFNANSHEEGICQGVWKCAVEYAGYRMTVKSF